MMIDGVSEYVHMDSFFRSGGHVTVTYEPTEFAFNYIQGTIYFDGDRDWVWFRQSPTSNRLLVDCDDVLTARAENRRIYMLWDLRDHAPIEHYLHVTYQITGKSSWLRKPDWRKEGF